MVVRYGRESGVPTPVNREMLDRVRTMEEHGAR
jgi:hypothetical protein